MDGFFLSAFFINMLDSCFYFSIAVHCPNMFDIPVYMPDLNSVHFWYIKKKKKKRKVYRANTS